MVYIVAAVAMFAFAYYWWRGTAFGGFCMTLPAIVPCVLIAYLMTEERDPVAVVAGIVVGGLIAWAPYLLKTPRLRTPRARALFALALERVVGVLFFAVFFGTIVFALASLPHGILYPSLTMIALTYPTMQTVAFVMSLVRPVASRERSAPAASHLGS